MWIVSPRLKSISYDVCAISGTRCGGEVAGAFAFEDLPDGGIVGMRVDLMHTIQHGSSYGKSAA